MADAVKSAGGQVSPVVTATTTPTRPNITKISTTSATGGTNKPTLTVPIINPAIKTMLSKLPQQALQQTPAGNRIILNATTVKSSLSGGHTPTESSTKTVKLIAVNSSTSNSSTSG